MLFPSLFFHLFIHQTECLCCAERTVVLELTQTLPCGAYCPGGRLHQSVLMQTKGLCLGEGWPGRIVASKHEVVFAVAAI